MSRDAAPSTPLSPWARLAAWLRGTPENSLRARQAWACFAGLYGYEPRLLPWVHAVPGTRWHLLLNFGDAFLRRYNGHEVVLFDDQAFLYYWLPGAKQNATGHVAPGHYALRLHTREASIQPRLELTKHPDGGFTVSGLTLAAAPALPGLIELQPRSLDYARYFVPELESLVLTWLTGYGQALHLGALRPSAEEAARLAVLLEPCRALEPLVRLRAGELLGRLDPRG